MLHLLAQALRDLYLATPRSGGRWNQARSWSLMKAEAVLRRIGDPLVVYTIGRHSLRLPLSHRLPIFRYTYPYYATNLGRVGRFIHAKYPDMTAIDIGANVADSVAILRAEAHFPILCIEGDSTFFPLLLTNTAQCTDVECVQCYVGDADRGLRAAIVREGGTARIDVRRSHVVLHTHALAGIVARSSRFARPRLLKIDTDGFDSYIIRSSIALIAQARPVIFFEYDPHLLAAHGDDGLSLFRVLHDNGYRDLLVYGNTGYLMGEARCDDEARLQEIHALCRPTALPNYVDIAAYHSQDQDLFETTLRAEEEFWNRPDLADSRPS